MKLRFVIVTLALCLLLAGVVSAEIPTTKVTGKITVPANSVVVTPPAAYTPWNLTFGKVNEITAGDIHVVSNCNYTLAVQASTGGYMIGEAGPAMSFPTLKYPILVYNGMATGKNTWSPIEGTNRTELVIYTGGPGTVDIPLKLRQDLHPDDADKVDPKIVLSYVVHIL